jgi:signal peptidase I
MDQGMKSFLMKSPWGTLLLSLALPGLGHVCMGKAVMGAGCLLATGLLGLGSVAYVLNPSTRVSPFILVPFLGALAAYFFSAWHAYYLARKSDILPGPSQGISPKMKARLIFGIAGVAVIYGLLGWLMTSMLAGSFTVPPDSMEPTIYNGERVLVNRLAYRIAAPQRGDIIIYKYPQDPSKIYIHRIVALPGESVELKDHQIIVNGVKLAEDWAVKIRHYNGGKLAKRGMKPVVVDPDSFYVLGDNAARSEDSRAWGFLPKKNIIGKAYKRYYPFDRSGPIE